MDSIMSLLGLTIPYEVFETEFYNIFLLFEFLFKGVFGLIVFNGVMNLISSWSLYLGSGRMLK